MIVLAHAGHWLVNLVYAAPVIALGGWIAVVSWKDRRARRSRDAAS